jgi:cytochrome c oxidase subunit 2
MLFQKAYAAGTIALPQAAKVAAKIDLLHDAVFWLSVVLLALVTAMLVVFIWNYHRSKTGRMTEYILGSHFFEALWTVIPLILFLGIFLWGYIDYLHLRTPLEDPLEINVVGRQWMWNFEYTNGRKTLNELFLPKGRAVKLIITSEDVIHSFFVPNFRLKQDSVPGMYTYLFFEPTVTGEHPIYCAEFCGTGHSDMLGKAIILEKEDFNQWFQTGNLPGSIKKLTQAVSPVSTAEASLPKKSLAEQGKGVFDSKGCFACHSVDGTAKIGPTLLKSFGRNEALQDGKTVTVDENYIRESLMDPQAKILKGFPPSMPTFRGLLTDDEVNALIAFIKSLK